MAMRGADVAVFGGSGFIGRSLVKRLAQLGARVRVVCRAPNSAGHLKTLGEVGQIIPVKLDGIDAAAVKAACGEATHVVNLIGILSERRRGDFDRVHADLAGWIAEAASACGAKALVQVSAIGATSSSESLYAQSKAAGEAKVLAAFPTATILRPSIVFGPGDGFFERFGDMATRSPFLPLVDGGKTLFQPVYVGDVADAIVAGLQGQAGTFELGGPEVYSFKYLLEYLLQVLGRRRWLMPMPSKLLKFPATLLEKLPNPQLTRDQLVLLRYDNVVGPNAKGLKSLGIEPTPLETIVPTYVRAYASIDARPVRN